MTLVFYEAPHRIEKMLEAALEVLGDRRCCIAREITKIHEEFLRGTIKEVLEECKDLKGEMVVVIEGNRDEPEKDIDYSNLIRMVNEAMEMGLTKSDAVKETAQKTGVSKNKIYDLVHNHNN